MVKGDGVSFLYQGMKSCCAKDLRVLLAVIFSLLDDVAGGESEGYIIVSLEMLEGLWKWILSFIKVK
ncbi:hypothetical protein JHK82_051406 [Glycine max]|nr:hypothetical protein JHK82_051406 [Glycine max]